MWKRILAAAILSAASGCAFMTPPPEVRQLPQASANLRTLCIRPEQIGNLEAEKGDALKIVSSNYKAHNFCADKVELWIDFYDKLVAEEKKKAK